MAGGVVLLCVCALAFDQPWLTVVIAYGFVARLLAGPRLSPLALLVVHVITPRLQVSPKWVPGPPKRFAQGIGAVFSLTAAILVLGFDLRSYGYTLLGLLIGAATLESVFAVCLGCWLFGLLMRLGVIPQSVCEACGNLRLARDQ